MKVKSEDKTCKKRQTIDVDETETSSLKKITLKILIDLKNLASHRAVLHTKKYQYLPNMSKFLMLNIMY